MNKNQLLCLVKIPFLIKEIISEDLVYGLLIRCIYKLVKLPHLLQLEPLMKEKSAKLGPKL